MNVSNCKCEAAEELWTVRENNEELRREIGRQRLKIKEMITDLKKKDEIIEELTSQLEERQSENLSLNSEVIALGARKEIDEIDSEDLQEKYELVKEKYERALRKIESKKYSYDQKEEWIRKATELMHKEKNEIKEAARKMEENGETEEEMQKWMDELIPEDRGSKRALNDIDKDMKRMENMFSLADQQIQKIKNMNEEEQIVTLELVKEHGAKQWKIKTKEETRKRSIEEITSLEDF